MIVQYDTNAYTDNNMFDDESISIITYIFTSAGGTHAFNASTQHFTEDLINGSYSISDNVIIRTQKSSIRPTVGFETQDIVLSPLSDWTADQLNVLTVESLRKMKVSLIPNYMEVAQSTPQIKNMTVIIKPNWYFNPAKTSILFKSNASVCNTAFKMKSRVSNALRFRVEMHNEQINDTFEIISLTMSAPAVVSDGGK